MPTYEYQCEKCKKSFDVFQSMNDAHLAVCPKDLCRQKTWGKGKVKRQMGTGAGIIFKGSGFYSTDYRSEGYKTAASNDATAAHEAAGAVGSKAAKEAKKEAAKTETKAVEKKPKGGSKAE